MTAVIQPPPRLSSRGGVENTQALLDWAYSMYQVLESEQKVLTRLNEIAAVSKLDQTISATPTQAEVQAIQTKINELIDAAQISTT